MARLARSLTLGTVALGTVALGIVAVTLVGFAFERIYQRLEKRAEGGR
jgi:hypothetical protein